MFENKNVFVYLFVSAVTEKKNGTRSMRITFTRNLPVKKSV